MISVKSIKTYFGTNAERVAAGLNAFLQGDEFVETDTEETYQHNGMAWVKTSISGAYLEIANNLSDLNNAATARANLGLVSGGAGDIWVEKAGDVMTGPLTVGLLLDVQSTGIIFNDGEADIDLRIAGNGVTNAYFYDAGLNRHGFGTGTPGAFVYIDNTETSGTPETGLTVDNTYSPSSDPGSVFPTSLSLLADYDSSTTPSGGFVLAQFLRARNVSNGVMSARCLDIQFQNLGTGTTPFFTGVNVRTPTNSGGGAITTAYGLKVESQNIAGTNYAVYTDAGRVRFGDGVTIDTTTAALTIPRMTTTQQNALTGVNGMLIFNSTTGKFTGYAGGAWVALH